MNCWIITNDYINDDRSEVETCGPSGATDDDIAALLTGEKFRMYDDDNKVYFEGLATTDSFAPLDDFGTPSYGCTRIDFWQTKYSDYEGYNCFMDAGQWVQL